MACNIPYIRNSNLPLAEVERLEKIHTDIFSAAKQSKAFREVNNRLQTIKNKYADATNFVAKVNQQYGPVSGLNSIGNGTAVFSVNVLPLAEKQGELFNLEMPKKETDPEILRRVKEVIKNMGIEIQDLRDYAKNSDLDLSGVNAVADAARGVIAVAEGKEEALTEEMVHIATSILEFTNPKMVTDMISRIDKFQIYKNVLDRYKNNPAYQLPNGKPNIRKIKKEAVDQLITELIINNGENTEQFPELTTDENQSLIRKWWNSILEWIRGLYKESNIDIFQEAASQIMSGVGTVGETSGEVFFQLTETQKQIQDRIKETKQKVDKRVETIKSADPLLLDSEEANNYYVVQRPDGTWERVKKRVTDRVKAWYKERFGNKVFSEQEKEFNEMKRQYGVQGHADMEEIHSRYFHEDGTKKEKPDPRPTKFNLPNQEMYDKLEKYYVDLVNSFPKDTLVFSEVIIYDEKQKEAGTIDFLAVEPDGKTHVFDWKFMSINKGQEDVAWYKKGAYNVQLSRYREILRDNYGVKQMGKSRAIPIIMNFAPESKAKNSPLTLKGIAIGTFDTSKIQDLTLLPVPEEAESTGHKALDAVITRLNAHIKEVAKERVFNEEDKAFKAERLDTLSRAVRLAQVTHNVVPLIGVIELLRKEGDRILEDYITTFKDKPASADDITNKDISDMADAMREYVKLSEVFTEIGDDLGELIYTLSMEKEAKTEEEKESLEERKTFLSILNDESMLIRRSQKKIREAMGEFADKHIGQRNLVTGLLKAEKVVKGLGSMFRGVSDIPLRSTQILYKLFQSAQGKASEDALKEIQTLMKIRDKLKERGGNLRDLVRQIYQKDDKDQLVNKLIDKFDRKFYAEVEAKAQAGGDLAWIKDNIDLEAYEVEAKAAMDKWIASIRRTMPSENADDLLAIERAILKVKQKFDISRKDFNGWNNYILKRHPKTKWYSTEYQSLLKDPDLLELYNFIVDFNEKAGEIGYIQNKIARTFLPFVRKTMAEQIAFDGNLSVVDKLQQQLEFRAEDVGYGNINELTGELENTIPKYYTYDFTRQEDGTHDYSDVSEDLFKNIILYIQQVNKYKYLSEIEGQLKLVKTIEESKSHLNTGRGGNVVLKNGNPEVLPGNAENAKMFDDFMRVMLYDQKYVLSDTDTPMNIGKVFNFVKSSINRMAGREIWKEKENPAPTSLIKTLDAINRAFQMKTLGFELISGAANMFGSNIQMATQAGNYFKAREFAKNEAKLTLQKFASKEDRDAFIELINTFMPLKEDPAYEIYKEAGMSVLTQQNLGDILMVFMRQPELLVEKAIFLSLLENMMVKDGRIISIREFVKSKYKDRYSSAARYNETKSLIEQEIEDLKKTSSIAATRKLENGKLVIPGLDLNNREEIQRLTNLTRRISRNATGGMADGDINRMSMSIWTKSMMVFKNWIPKLADTRFSEFRRISDDFSVRINEDGMVEGQKYDIGRIRLLWYVMGKAVQERSNAILNILYLNDKGLNTLDSMFEEFRAKYEAETGETLEMTRDEFIDLIRNNLRNQIKELLILGSLIGATLSLGFMEPEDEDSKAARNFFRYSQRVVDKFVSELSFFYNPVEVHNILSGGMFPAIGLISDFARFTKHFIVQTTGMDFDPSTTYEEAREKAKPIKYGMKLMPITKPILTYGAILSDEFAEEMDITIQAENRR